VITLSLLTKVMVTLPWFTSPPVSTYEDSELFPPEKVSAAALSRALRATGHRKRG
jgi:hypothetical protein